MAVQMASVYALLTPTCMSVAPGMATWPATAAWHLRASTLSARSAVVMRSKRHGRPAGDGSWLQGSSGGRCAGSQALVQKFSDAGLPPAGHVCGWRYSAGLTVWLQGMPLLAACIAAVLSSQACCAVCPLMRTMRATITPSSRPTCARHCIDSCGPATCKHALLLCHCISCLA